MINFRYHVVSLVAVFLALAVGILLGAGPLKEPIESSLAEQVSLLRDDKQLLRDELTAASARERYAGSAFSALQPQALSGLLTGQAVAVVTIGADAQARLEDLEAGLELAGADLAGEVNLRDEWASGSDSARSEAAAAVADLLGETGAEGDRALIAAGLAVALRGSRESPRDDAADPSGEPSQGPDGEGPEPSDSATGGNDGDDGGSDGGAGTGGSDGDGGEDGSGGDGGAGSEGGTGSGGGSGGGGHGAGTASGPEPVNAEELLAALDSAGLASGSVTGPATAVIVLAGPYIADPARIEPETATTGRREAFTGVVSALVGAGLRTVVCGPDQADSDLVHRLRADPAFNASISTVTAPLAQAETITSLWALAASYHSVHGAYGLSSDDSELPPYRPAPREASGGSSESPSTEPSGEPSGNPSDDPSGGVDGGADGTRSAEPDGSEGQP